MLSKQLDETLAFIKSFVEKNQRTPRLKELKAEFNDITNKAILDRLSNLQKAEYISMTDGVLSMKLINKDNDIFISYSSDNKTVAQKVFDYFVDEGFKVWKDNMSIDYGENFVSKVFENIKKSKTFIVLLSKSALESKFVREEVSCAKKAYIDHDKPTILPVKVKDDFKSRDIFPEISSLKYHGLKDGFNDQDLMYLADKIHMLAYEHVNMGDYKKKKGGTKGLSEFRKKAYQDMDKAAKKSPPPDKKYSYREALIAPLGERKEYNNHELEDIVRNSVVKIQGWGGDRFPAYYQDYGYEAELMSGRIRNQDLKAWPDRRWGFSYWSMDKNLNFITRSVLREAYSDREGMENKFSVDWLVLDVARPLIFLRELVNLQTGIKKWKFKLEYRGLEGKELVILSNRRHGLMASYKCGEDTLPYEFEIDENTDLKQVAFDICYDVSTLFNWRKPNEEVLWKDINNLFDNGSYAD